MAVINYYRGLLNNSSAVLDSMIVEGGASEKLIVSHNYLLDYEAMRSAIADRPEVSVFDLAIKEYQFSLFALISGQYRYAFGGLRLFFELMLATIQFSAHEIDYRMWLKGAKDINWGALRDSQNGVFSKTFIQAFNADFGDYAKQYLAIAESVYRECSEYVHGNAGTHDLLPSDIVFKKEVFQSWHRMALTMRLAVIFVFAVRYLSLVDNDKKNALEHVMMDSLGHLTPVQDLFSKSYVGV